MRVLLVAVVLAMGLPAVVGGEDAFAAEPAPADAGLAAVVNGKVTVQPAGGKAPIAVTPYMKLRVGDVVEVGKDGSVEVMYFGGRRETWTAGARFKVGDAGSEAVAGEPKVADAGDKVGASFEALPIMLRHAEADRAGQTLVRGKSQEELALDEVEKAQVAEAREIYAKWRAEAAPGDILPEMYLASVLLPLNLNSEAIEVLEKAVAACPKCEEPKVLLEWARTRAQL